MSPPAEAESEDIDDFDISSVCKRCAADDHWSKDCRNERVFFCWICGRKNTRTTTCCSASEEKNNSSASKGISYPKEPIYFDSKKGLCATVSFGHDLVLAKIDTSSFRSFVGPLYANELGTPTNISKANVFVKMIDGSEKYFNEQLRIRMKFGDWHGYMHFLINDDLKGYIILGLDFLNLTNAKLAICGVTYTLQDTEPFAKQKTTDAEEKEKPEAKSVATSTSPIPTQTVEFTRVTDQQNQKTHTHVDTFESQLNINALELPQTLRHAGYQSAVLSDTSFVCSEERYQFQETNQNARGKPDPHFKRYRLRSHEWPPQIAELIRLRQFFHQEDPTHKMKITYTHNGMAYRIILAKTTSAASVRVLGPVSTASIPENASSNNLQAPSPPQLSSENRTTPSGCEPAVRRVFDPSFAKYTVEPSKWCDELRDFIEQDRIRLAEDPKMRRRISKLYTLKNGVSYRANISMNRVSVKCVGFSKLVPVVGNENMDTLTSTSSTVTPSPPPTNQLPESTECVYMDLETDDEEPVSTATDKQSYTCFEQRKGVPTTNKSSNEIVHLETESISSEDENYIAENNKAPECSSISSDFPNEFSSITSESEIDEGTAAVNATLAKKRKRSINDQESFASLSKISRVEVLRDADPLSGSKLVGKSNASNTEMNEPNDKEIFSAEKCQPVNDKVRINEVSIDGWDSTVTSSINMKTTDVEMSADKVPVTIPETLVGAAPSLSEINIVQVELPADASTAACNAKQVTIVRENLSGNPSTNTCEEKNSKKLSAGEESIKKSIALTSLDACGENPTTSKEKITSRCTKKTTKINEKSAERIPNAFSVRMGSTKNSLNQEKLAPEPFIDLCTENEMNRTPTQEEYLAAGPTISLSVNKKKSPNKATIFAIDTNNGNKTSNIIKKSTVTDNIEKSANEALIISNDEIKDSTTPIIPGEAPLNSRDEESKISASQKESEKLLQAKTEVGITETKPALLPKVSSKRLSEDRSAKTQPSKLNRQDSSVPNQSTDASVSTNDKTPKPNEVAAASPTLNENDNSDCVVIIEEPQIETICISDDEDTDNRKADNNTATRKNYVKIPVPREKYPAEIKEFIINTKRTKSFGKKGRKEKLIDVNGIYYQIIVKRRKAAVVYICQYSNPDLNEKQDVTPQQFKTSRAKNDEIICQSAAAGTSHRISKVSDVKETAPKKGCHDETLKITKNKITPDKEAAEKPKATDDKTKTPVKQQLTKIVGKGDHVTTQKRLLTVEEQPAKLRELLQQIRKNWTGLDKEKSFVRVFDGIAYFVELHKGKCEKVYAKKWIHSNPCKPSLQSNDNDNQAPLSPKTVQSSGNQAKTSVNEENIEDANNDNQASSSKIVRSSGNQEKSSVNEKIIEDAKSKNPFTYEDDHIWTFPRNHTIRINLPLSEWTEEICDFITARFTGNVGPITSRKFIDVGVCDFQLHSTGKLALVIRLAYSEKIVDKVSSYVHAGYVYVAIKELTHQLISKVKVPWNEADESLQRKIKSKWRGPNFHVIRLVDNETVYVVTIDRINKVREVERLIFEENDIASNESASIQSMESNKHSTQNSTVVDKIQLDSLRWPFEGMPVAEIPMGLNELPPQLRETIELLQKESTGKEEFFKQAIDGVGYAVRIYKSGKMVRVQRLIFPENINSAESTEITSVELPKELENSSEATFEELSAELTFSPDEVLTLNDKNQETGDESNKEEGMPNISTGDIDRNEGMSGPGLEVNIVTEINVEDMPEAANHESNITAASNAEIELLHLNNSSMRKEYVLLSELPKELFEKIKLRKLFSNDKTEIFSEHIDGVQYVIKIAGLGGQVSVFRYVAIGNVKETGDKDDTENMTQSIDDDIENTSDDNAKETTTIIMLEKNGEVYRIALEDTMFWAKYNHLVTKETVAVGREPKELKILIEKRKKRPKRNPISFRHAIRGKFYSVAVNKKNIPRVCRLEFTGIILSISKVETISPQNNETGNEAEASQTQANGNPRTIVTVEYNGEVFHIILEDEEFWFKWKHLVRKEDLPAGGEPKQLEKAIEDYRKRSEDKDVTFRLVLDGNFYTIQIDKNGGVHKARIIFSCSILNVSTRDSQQLSENEQETSGREEQETVENHISSATKTQPTTSKEHDFIDEINDFFSSEAIRELLDTYPDNQEDAATAVAEIVGGQHLHKRDPPTKSEESTHVLTENDENKTIDTSPNNKLAETLPLNQENKSTNSPITIMLGDENIVSDEEFISTKEPAKERHSKEIPKTPQPTFPSRPLLKVRTPADIAKLKTLPFVTSSSSESSKNKHCIISPSKDLLDETFPKHSSKGVDSDGTDNTLRSQSPSKQKKTLKKITLNLKTNFN